MSSRKERKNRWGLRCPRCGAWKAKHAVGGGLYTCQPLGTVESVEEDQHGLVVRGRLFKENND